MFNLTLCVRNLMQLFINSCYGHSASIKSSIKATLPLKGVQIFFHLTLWDHITLRQSSCPLLHTNLKMQSMLIKLHACNNHELRTCVTIEYVVNVEAVFYTIIPKHILTTIYYVLFLLGQASKEEIKYLNMEKETITIQMMALSH